MTAAMGGFFLGQLFARQTQVKPALLHFACIRVDRKEDMLDTLAEVLKDAFLDVASETELDLEFTNKGELKVLRKKRGYWKNHFLFLDYAPYLGPKKIIFSLWGSETKLVLHFQ